MTNTVHYGMLTGKRIFFYDMTKSSLIDKVKRILKRLKAEIVEIYDGENINMVIYDTENVTNCLNDSQRKRKSNMEINCKAKRQRLCLKNNFINKQVNDSNDLISINNSSLSQFLSHAKDKGSKVKTVNEVWKWLMTYYKWLAENDEPQYSIKTNPNLDKYQRIKLLQLPALKILDPFGGTSPTVVENSSIDKRMWKEFTDDKSLEMTTEFKRKSTGTSRRIGKDADGMLEYCLICMKSFKDLYQHLNELQHKLFADDSANFVGIDQFIAQIPSISDFLTSRQSLWEKHKQLKRSMQNLPRSLKHISIDESSLNPATENSVVNDNQFSKLGANSLPSDSSSSTSKSSSSTSSTSSTTSSTTSSSTSSTSSSFSSSEKASDSSCESDSDSSSKDFKKIDKNDCISSTPINQKIKCNFFSPDSISTEDKQQSQISLHVNEIIETLDWQLSKVECSLIKSKCLNESPILTRRFDWCKICKRNHVPVDDESFQCQFSPIRTDRNHGHEVDIDGNGENYHGTGEGKPSSNDGEDCFVTLNRKFSQEFCLSDHIFDKRIYSDTKIRPFVIERDDLLPICNFEIDNNQKLKENENIICQKKLPLIDLIKPEFNQNKPDIIRRERNVNDKNKFVEISSLKNNEKSLSLDFNNSFEDCYVRVERMESEVANSKSRKRPEMLSRKNEDKLDNIGDDNSSILSILDKNEGKFKSKDKIPIIRKSRSSLVLLGDFDPLSPVSGKRKAAITANRGIENSNRFFDTNIKETIKLMEESYEPFVYDPREILKKLTYPSKSRRILEERNL